MTDAAPEFCKQPGGCMIGCHDCLCDLPGGPYYCERDQPAYMGKCTVCGNYAEIASRQYQPGRGRLNLCCDCLLLEHQVEAAATTTDAPPVLFRRALLVLDRCLSCGRVTLRWLDARHARRWHRHDNYPF